MELSGSNIKFFFYFPPPPKKIYISGNINLKKLFISQEIDLCELKI